MSGDYDHSAEAKQRYENHLKAARHAHMNQVLNEVRQERVRQDNQLGGVSFEDAQTEENWINYINQYATEEKEYSFRQKMLAVAAFAVAAIESHDRKHGTS